MSEKKSSVKKRNWAFVVYPESAPSDWREQLQLTGLQCAVSPLHDKDMNADNTPKKAHWHVIACYSGPTSYNIVQKLTEQLNAPIPQALEQIRGYYRYLTHKDNPEKVQYSELKITTINGFNIADFVELSKSEIVEIKRKLQRFIRDENIVEYGKFMDVLQDNEMNLEYEVACSNTMFFNTYLKSRRHTREQSVKIKYVDKATGEVFDELPKKE